MNISAYILEYLKQFGTVTVPDFGVFSLENSKAIINSENGSILPPASKIVYIPDYRVKSDDLAAFIAGHKQMTLEASGTDLQIQTDFWKKKLQADQMLEIQGLGTIFIEDGETHFKGNRLQSDHPDFYGLEEIKFSDISNKESKTAVVKNSEKDYRFNKSILWIFLIIIPVLGILYVAYTQQELLFGKKSFDAAQISVQTTTHRIPKDTVKAKKITPLVTADSLKKDSLKKDSVAKQNILPASNHAVKAKTPLYNTKKKWQK
jgi:CCDC81-like prokaryotic HU domain 1